MHEVSLVRALILHAVKAAQPVPADCIRKLRVCLGPLTGVEPLLVQQAFDELKLSFDLSDCQLEIDEQKLMAICLQCHSDFEVVDFAFRCPSCQSGSVRVTGGDDFRLISLEVDDAAPDSSPPEQQDSPFTSQSLANSNE